LFFFTCWHRCSILPDSCYDGMKLEQTVISRVDAATYQLLT
jgi:hypothetical protein